MTDITEPGVDTLAQQIADRGREALVQRLRGAYADAAAAHADIVSLDEARIEALVQSAADHADGLQWRRALAGVAAQELGVSVAEALSHPAVARAQTLVGAPSYEQSLAELIARPVPPPAAAPANGSALTGASADAPAAVADSEPELAPDAASAVPEPEPPAPEPPAPEPPEPPEPTEPEPPSPESQPTAVHEAVPALSPVTLAESEQEEVPETLSDELEAIEADDEIFDLLPEPEPIELETELYELAGEYIDDDAPPTLEPEPFEVEDAQVVPHPEDTDLRVSAVHLGGVANLPTHREGLELRLSGNGLDILQAQDEIIGRLVWDEIDALEVPHLRSRRRRQQKVRARLVVRTSHGDASFEIPGFSSDDLRDRIEPLISRFGRH
jgi:hypothetical protein